MAIREEFYEFKSKTGPFYGGERIQEIYGDGFKALATWLRLQYLGSTLARTAIRVFGYLASFMPSERSFSAMNFIHNTRRNCLSSEDTDMMTFIYMNSRVLYRLDV